MALTTWDEQSFYQDYRAQLAQNGARTGRSLHRVISQGAGETHIVQPLEFQLTFVSQPTFTSGLALAAGQLVPGVYPIASVGVFKWRTDSRGFFTGAYIWVAVTFGPNSLDADGNLVHSAASIDQIQRELGQLGGSQTLEQRQELYQASRAIAMNKLQLEHHLCFEGLALRDVNFDTMMADG